MTLLLISGSAFLLSFSFSSAIAVAEADSGVLNGPSNLQGACAVKGSGRGEVGDATTEGSNEKGRWDAGGLLAGGGC